MTERGSNTGTAGGGVISTLPPSSSSSSSSSSYETSDDDDEQPFTPMEAGSSADYTTLIAETIAQESLGLVEAGGGAVAGIGGGGGGAVARVGSAKRAGSAPRPVSSKTEDEERRRVNARRINGEPIYFSGELTKRGALVKNWKRRWFCVLDTHILYYENERASHVGGGDSGKHALGRIEFAAVRDVKSGEEYCTKEHAFVLVTPERTYYLVADTHALKNRWLRKLGRSVTRFSKLRRERLLNQQS